MHHDNLVRFRNLWVRETKELPGKWLQKKE
jgi:hypothetical protein